MKRIYERAVIACMLFTVLALWLAMTASAQPAPAASAASAPAGPVLTPDTACGAPGVGLDLGGNLIVRDTGMPGLRVDANGKWDWCQMPAPPRDCRVGVNGVYAWTVAGNTCRGTGAPDYLLHGQTIALLHQHGPMRGAVGVTCSDGGVVHVWQSCSPATECDSAWYSSDDGGKTIYVYDARPRAKRVPLGGYVYATAESGAKQLLQCVAGSFQRSTEVEPPKPVEPKPAAVTCGPQRVNAWVVYRYMPLQYAGLPLAVGATASVQGVTLTCGADGKLTGPIPPTTDGNNPWERKQ